MRRLARALSHAAVMLLAAFPAAAQTGAISGVVTDAETGAPIAGATVLLRGTPLATAASTEGRFLFSRLDAGSYRVFVAAIGYAADSVPAVVLAEGERADMALALHRSPLELQEIVVTSSRSAELADESTVSVATLPVQSILQRNVQRLDQALVFVSGVTFNGNDQLDIRGASGIAKGVGSRVLMLLDGHPILSANGGEINFSNLPMLDLRGTEIVKGAYSATYGSNALGGVVNLITAPIGEQPQTALRVSAGAYNYPSDYKWTSSTQNFGSIGVQHARRIGGVGFRAYAGYEGTDGYTENGGASTIVGRLKAQSSSDAEHPWDAYAIFSREHDEDFFVWEDPEAPYRPPQQYADDYSIGYSVLSGATITPMARSRTLLKLSPYFNYSSNQNHFAENQDWQRAYKPGVIAAFNWFASERQSFTFGGDLAHTWTESSFLGAPTVLDAAAFVQDELQFADGLKVNAGVRLDHHKASTTDAEWALSPKLGASLRVAPRVSLRASVGAGYRAPSPIEQFVSTIQSGYQVVPNPELTGERAWSAEVGSTATLFNRVRIDGAVFGSYYDDLIAPGPAPGQPFVFQFQNVSRARVFGFDLGVNSYLIPNWLEAQFTYLYLNSEDLDTGKELPYRSPHNLTATVNVWRQRIGVDLRYRSRIPEVLAYPLDPRGDMTVVDLRAAYDFFNVTWQMKLGNVFNTFFVDVQERIPSAPRSLTLTAVYGI
jgi:outer membrane receptor for ferrienterochelin and colicins